VRPLFDRSHVHVVPSGPFHFRRERPPRQLRRQAGTASRGGVQIDFESRRMRRHGVNSASLDVQSTPPSMTSLSFVVKSTPPRSNRRRSRSNPRRSRSNSRRPSIKSTPPLDQIRGPLDQIRAPLDQIRAPLVQMDDLALQTRELSDQIRGDAFQDCDVAPSNRRPIEFRPPMTGSETQILTSAPRVTTSIS